MYRSCESGGLPARCVPAYVLLCMSHIHVCVCVSSRLAARKLTRTCRCVAAYVAYVGRYACQRACKEIDEFRG